MADYAIARHFPELVDSSEKYLQFFRAVADRQAALVAQWQLVGFIHGVMNTDNMAIWGETIDYGPCAFMNSYDPATVYSSIDSGGRYAYGNQPNIVQWNLARFAETLLTLLDSDPKNAVAKAMEVLNAFPAMFEGYWLAGMRKKLGLQSEEAGDRALVQSLLDWMQQNRADFTNTFRDLSAKDLPADERYRDPTFQEWYTRWQQRVGQNGYDLMRTVNPVVIPRNHRVEEALSAAEEQDEITVMQRLLTVLEKPYETRPEFAKYQEPPENESGYRTFCGT